MILFTADPAVLSHFRASIIESYMDQMNVNIQPATLSTTEGHYAGVNPKSF